MNATPFVTTTISWSKQVQLTSSNGDQEGIHFHIGRRRRRFQTSLQSFINDARKVGQSIQQNLFGFLNRSHQIGHQLEEAFQYVQRQVSIGWFDLAVGVDRK